MPNISIVIPTYNHLEDFLKPCCQSIIDYTDLSDIEIIIVANGCKDGTREYVESLGPNFKLVWFDKGLGYTMATNEGVKAASGEFIILMNNDVVLLKQRKHEWIDFLIDPLKDKIGITCNLKIWDNSVERMFAVGFLMCFPRYIWDKIGGFDPAWSPGGGEDIEFCLQVEQLGYKIIQVPDEHNDIKDGLNVNRFMSYHKGEGTVMDAEHREMWEKHITDVRKRLEDKYKLPPGWFYNYDIEEYRRLVEDLPDGANMIELGCYKGRSLCAVSDIIRRKKINVWAVDTFVGTLSERHIEDNYRLEFINNCKRFGIEPIVLQDTTVDAAQAFSDHFFDLIFIDADHEYNAFRKDVEDWLPKVKEHGTISGHDYGNHEGVSRYLNRIWDHIRVYGSVWSKRV